MDATVSGASPRRPNTADVARGAGVNLKTVSRVSVVIDDYVGARGASLLFVASAVRSATP